VVFAVSYLPDAVTIVQAMHDRGYRPPALLASGSSFLSDAFIAGVSQGNAGSTDPYKIQAQLRRVDLPASATIMPWRGIQFSASGQNTRSQIVLQQLIGGRYHVVYPDDKATDAATFP
jgi:hypothetical protein